MTYPYVNESVLKNDDKTTDDLLNCLHEKRTLSCSPFLRMRDFLENILWFLSISNIDLSSYQITRITTP